MHGACLWMGVRRRYAGACRGSAGDGAWPSSRARLGQARGAGRLGGAKLADIRKLMAINNSDNMAQQLAQQMVDRLKAALPQVPEEFWQKFSAEVKPDELQNRMADIYAQNLTDEDVKAVPRLLRDADRQEDARGHAQVQTETVHAAQRWSKEVDRKGQVRARRGAATSAGPRSTAARPSPLAPSMESTAPAAPRAACGLARGEWKMRGRPIGRPLCSGLSAHSPGAGISEARADEASRNG